MPIGPAHKRQRAKNFFMLGILLSIVGLFYYLTMLKIRGA